MEELRRLFSKGLRFYQAYDGLLGIVGLLIRSPEHLHLGDVVFIEFGHAPHFFPATA